MTAQINKIEADLLRFILARGSGGITRVELKEQYNLDGNIIILALVKLVRLGVLEEEPTRVTLKDGKSCVTKLVRARTKQG